MSRGTAVHALVFGTRDVIAYHGRRAGKDWEAFRDAHGSAEILTAAEYDKAFAMAEAVRAHPWAATMLRVGCVFEQTMLWERCGIKCRSTPDIRHADFIGDLKTSRTSKPDWFATIALKLFYHGQLAWYGEACRATGRPDPKHYYLIAVEPDPPHVVTVFRFSDRAIEAGNKLWRSWFEKLVVAHKSGLWTPYTQAIEEIDTVEDIELTFGEQIVGAPSAEETTPC